MRRAVRIACLAAVGVLAFAAAACSSTPFSIVGKWEMETCIIDGKTLEQPDPCTFCFRTDGTGEKCISGKKQFGFSYSFDGRTCILYGITYEDGTTEAGSCGDVTVLAKDRFRIRSEENGITTEIVLKYISGTD